MLPERHLHARMCRTGAIWRESYARPGALGFSRTARRTTPTDPGSDIDVYLLSRIKEARDNGAPDSEAVAIGLERTGRIVTAAALLFAVALGAFATSKLVFIKELGLGSALAVLIDSSIIRALLVPSLMALLGKWNWWAPAPRRRLHRRIGLNERAAPRAPAAQTPSPDPV